MHFAWMHRDSFFLCVFFPFHSRFCNSNFVLARKQQQRNRSQLKKKYASRRLSLSQWMSRESNNNSNWVLWFVISTLSSCSRERANERTSERASCQLNITIFMSSLANHPGASTRWNRSNEKCVKKSEWFCESKIIVDFCTFMSSLIIVIFIVERP